MLYICASFSVGETIPVRVARFNHKRVTIDREAYNREYAGRAGAGGGATDDFGTLQANAEGLATLLRRSSAASTVPGVADELTKLAALRDRGILTDAEFADQKAKLLAR
jgi:hypothetical protein